MAQPGGVEGCGLVAVFLYGLAGLAECSWFRVVLSFNRVVMGSKMLGSKAEEMMDEGVLESLVLFMY